MTIFTKPIVDITYQDVVEFCEKYQPEGSFLDYKEDFPPQNEKLAKTIAAFANTWGGVLLIGVKDDKDGNPQPPFEGIPCRTGLHERVEEIIFSNIRPPVFTEVKVVQSSDELKAFVLVRVPQSNDAHILNKEQAVYIRTGRSSRPEEVISPEQIIWLQDRRKKSEELRESIYLKSEERFSNYCRLHKIAEQNIPGLCSISIMPLYPQKPLINYWEIPDIAGQISVFSNSYRNNYPFYVANAKTVQGGISCFALVENQLEHFWELNHFGLLWHKEPVAVGRDAEFVVELQKITSLICLIFKASLNFYRQLSYWGLLEFRLKVENISGAKSNTGDIHLPSFYVMEPVPDKELSWQREFSFKELEDSLDCIIVEILRDVIWSM
ncbi:MAG TPA: hypothetical protein DIS73_00595, partial [Planctomycetia bacterium]|nr:hypothetical protein [Planctomycetia bacterium]